MKDLLTSAETSELCCTCSHSHTHTHTHKHALSLVIRGMRPRGAPQMSTTLTLRRSNPRSRIYAR